MKLDETHAHEEEDVRRLREFAAFGKFSDADLHRLVRASQHLSSSTPWPLIHEQTPADAVFILIGGEAAVYVGDDRIAVLEPGEVIGESVLRRGKLRPAHCYIPTRCPKCCASTAITSPSSSTRCPPCAKSWTRLPPSTWLSPCRRNQNRTAPR